MKKTFKTVEQYLLWITEEEDRFDEDGEIFYESFVKGKSLEELEELENEVSHEVDKNLAKFYSIGESIYELIWYAKEALKEN